MNFGASLSAQGVGGVEPKYRPSIEHTDLQLTLFVTLTNLWQEVLGELPVCSGVSLWVPGFAETWRQKPVLSACENGCVDQRDRRGGGCQYHLRR